jgi:ATP-binding cassette subfamily F protein 3
VLELADGQATEFNGNYEEYTALKAEEKAKKLFQKEPQKSATATPTQSYRSKEDRAAETKKRLRIKEIENKISALEEEETSINIDLATPEVSGNFSLLTEKCNRLESLKAELDALYEEYEKLI